MKNLSKPIGTIGGVNRPWGVAVNQRGEIIVAEFGGHCISIFSPSGEKIRTFRSWEFAQGQFNEPSGVAIDGDGNILVVDGYNHRILKFTGHGKFLTEREQALTYPSGIAVNHRNRKVHVCDSDNYQIQVLNADLMFSCNIGDACTVQLYTLMM